MADVVYRMVQGEGMQITEDAGTKTVILAVPSLSTKLNVGDIVQASVLQSGIVELATSAETQAGSDTERAVTPAGLAAAAQANSVDATAGRLLRMGGFGLGLAVSLSDGVDLNTVVNSGFYRLNATHVNMPSGASSGQMVVSRGSDTITQILFDYAGAAMYFRSGNPTNVGGSGAWSAWRSTFHTGNFDPASKANVSGTYLGITAGDSARLNGQTDAQLAPPGKLGEFVTPTAPNGWLHANGAAVSRTQYAALFAAIGTAFGAGNGSSTFNLPDLRGMFLRSWDGGRNIDPGRALLSSQNSANLQHAHGASTGAAGDHAHGGTTDAAGAHYHLQGGESLQNLYGGGSFVGFRNYPSGSFLSYTQQNTSTDGVHSHNITTSTAGNHSHGVTVAADGAAEARPINIAVLLCIKT